MFAVMDYPPDNIRDCHADEDGKLHPGVITKPEETP
jgi:hypothetical protein